MCWGNIDTIFFCFEKEKGGNRIDRRRFIDLKETFTFPLFSNRIPFGFN